MAKAMSMEELKGMVGKEVGVSDWFLVEQSRVNAFAEATEDRQWIHVDEDKAKLGPFGKTIAHGYLTLSLLSFFSSQTAVFPEGIKMAINYGLNKVRFLTPVPVGSKIRSRAVLKEVTDKGGGRVLMCTESTVEIEGVEKPAMVAETLAMMFT